MTREEMKEILLPIVKRYLVDRDPEAVAVLYDTMTHRERVLYWQVAAENGENIDSEY